MRFYDRQIHETLNRLIERNLPLLVGAVCQLMSCLFCEPEQLTLWFKFDSVGICNAACTQTLFVVHGKPAKIPPARGIYKNWGYLFD
jgi:hypothetical protein